MHWKDWSWSWNSKVFATWCKELTRWKRPWCWERLRAGGEGDDRGWDSWMASLTQWTWVWMDSGSWWWTGRPGVLQFMGSQRVEQDWTTELNWTEPYDWERSTQTSQKGSVDYSGLPLWAGVSVLYFSFFSDHFCFPPQVTNHLSHEVCMPPKCLWGSCTWEFDKEFLLW